MQEVEGRPARQPLWAGPGASPLVFYIRILAMGFRLCALVWAGPYAVLMIVLVAIQKLFPRVRRSSDLLSGLERTAFDAAYQALTEHSTQAHINESRALLSQLERGGFRTFALGTVGKCRF